MIKLSGINIAVKNVNMQTEIKIKKHVYVQYLEIKEELIQVMKVVKLVAVMVVLRKIFSIEAKIQNIIQKIKKEKIKEKNQVKILKPETVVVKIV